jgi:hypothetical protein
MHNVIKQLAKVADRYAPSRLLSYDLAHVFRALQLIDENGRISRKMLIDELMLGEGSIKTLVKHLKMQSLVETSNAGMWFTSKGQLLYSNLKSSMPEEMILGKCSLGLGDYNHAILLKALGNEIGTGIEQRDAAIKIGGIGATTLIYQEKKFLMPDRNQDSLRKDSKLKEQILENLSPKENDVIIIASSNNKKNANLAAKSAALQTISDHEKH